MTTNESPKAYPDTDNPSLSAFGEACIHTVETNTDVSKLQTVKAWIQECCPEIMEPVTAWVDVSDDEYSGEYVIAKSSPITLSHVLRAMKQNTFCIECVVFPNNKYCKKGMHESKKYSFDLGVSMLLDKWDLTKDLEDQSPETIDFLYSLIPNS